MDTLNRALPTAHFTLAQTTEFKNIFYAKLPAVQQFKWKVEDLIRRRAVAHPERIGYVVGLSGRRYLCEAELAYKITNFICQGESAGLFKSGMLRLSELLRGKRTKLINVVHDEYVFEWHVDELALVKQIRDTIEADIRWRVPIFTSVALSRGSWADKKELTHGSLEAGTWVRDFL